MKQNRKSIIIISSNRLSDVYEKGNISYVKHYEAFFDFVYVVYLTGEHPKIVRMGKTVLVSLGSSKNFLYDIFMAPLKIASLVSRIKPSILLTADIVFSFWTLSLVRPFKKVFLMPVCHVNEIMKSKKPYFFKSKWLDKLTLNLSFFTAHKILLNKKYTDLSKYFEDNFITKNKIKYSSTLVEELPSIEFLNKLNDAHCATNMFPEAEKQTILLHVGRIAKDKFIEDLIDMMDLLIRKNTNVILYLIGPKEPTYTKNIYQRIQDLKLDKYVRFIGAVDNSKLIPYCKQADIIVSPKMGTALRECALCGSAIVSYNDAFTNATFVHHHDCYITPQNTPEALSSGVLKILKDNTYRTKLKQNILVTSEQWNIHSPKKFLEKCFLEFV